MSKGKLKLIGKRAVIKLDKYAPEIYLGLGFAGMGLGVLTACKATHDMEPDIAKYKERIKAIEDAKGGRKEIIFATKDLIVSGCKRYAIPALLLGGSGYSFCKSYSKSKEQKTAAIAAYTGLQGVFSQYRERVKERWGEEVETEIRTGAKRVTGVVTDVNENGEEVNEEKEVLSVGGEIPVMGASQYAVWFDEYNSSQWQRDFRDNENFLLSQRAFFNSKLQAEGFVLLSDVYQALGIRRSKDSLHAGWLRDSKIGDGYISFGNLEPFFIETGDFVHETGRVSKRLSGHGYFLDFNVDGDISDYI